ncbi:hypothetical protein WEN_01445 [Mycoplasma wenyonii str. Massachusetts]|uniref:Lipoprotein n=1 Tax=Mycoplasma wenyonii (strain Massachusetts) TaxID=1197325 RepID=I6YLB8_MYCWM|nr:hypothetical protein [Mycoplasma wenyonii]AFN65084.1 hypothetical protein WEN_01445 [Mycoplasma wenyonii str. Massachusetts]
MLGAKFLLITAVGGVGSVIGCTSLSGQDWDPEYVWRVGSKREFYLTTCTQRREDDQKGAGNRWIYSDLHVYLTFDENVPQAKNNVKLKLIGKGNYQKFVGTNPETSITYKNSEDLHQTIENENKDSRFSLTVSASSGNSWLGEAGGGEESSSWGLIIRCDINRKIFTFSDLTGTQKSAHLSQITFSLDNCDTKNYKGIKGCSIKIEDKVISEAVGHNTGLKWAEGFNPLVII